MNVINLYKLLQKRYATIEDIKLFTNLNDEYCHRIFNHLKEISKYKGYLDKKNKVNMKIFIEYFHINVDKVSNAVQEIKKNYDVDKLGVINCKEI